MILLAALASMAAAAAPFDDADELLPAEQAFALKGSVVDADNLRLDWTIADGYYMYRERIKISANTDGVTLGTPELPDGKVKHDEFFGDMEIYRGDVQAKIPLDRHGADITHLTLTVVSQGCADRGVCYPPLTRKVDFELPAPNATAAAPAAPATNLLKRLTGPEKAQSGLGGDDELLDADEAFRFSAEVADASTVVAHWDIAQGYYLYRNRFKFSVPPGSAIQPGEPEFPAGEHKNDEFFGDIEIYHNQVEARIPLQRATADAGTLELTVGYQGCAERGVCYPPIKKTVSLAIPAAAASTPANGPGAPTLSEQDAIAKRLAEGNIWATLAAFFGVGLLLAFTPCVFPMIPILSSIIVGQGDRMTARHGFVLSSVYVLAMAATYTAAGVVAGLFGENLQAAFQNPWILSAFALVFVLLALSMFGFYELQMPASIQGRLTELSNRQKGGSLAGVAVMGFLSALIVGPCVAAPLAGALIFIGRTGDWVLGGMALFALSLGMGAPLVAIGTGAGKLLPRAGQWMDAVKAVFGVMLLAVAIWMLERILPPMVSMLLWSALLIVSAVYMGAWTILPADAGGWRKLWKGGGLMLFVYGALLLIGAAGGGTDPLKPLDAFTSRLVQGAVSVEQTRTAFATIKTLDDLQRELAAAAAKHQPAMLDFYADWCVSCKEMDKYTFETPQVRQALSQFRLLRADVTANDAADKALLKHFELVGPPGIIFYDRSGAEHPELRLVGFKPADEFIAHIRSLN